MALGKVSSLGFGSQVLTQDVIDKLKAADEAGQIKPVTAKITANATKQKDLTALKTLIGTFRSSVSTLADDSSYQKRTTTADGKSAEVTASAGVAVQDIEIDVRQLAKKDVYQSTKFATSSSFIGKNGTFGIKVGGTTHKIEVRSSTTLEELADKINEVTNGAVSAKAMKVGGEDPYQLILQSKETGAENKIEITDVDSDGSALSGASDVLQKLGWDSANIASNKISTAQDAEFVYNGITIKRSGNEVKDLNLGMTIKLKDTGKTTFSIKEDASAIKESMQSLVTAYNNLTNNLKVATDYDSDTKKSGTFQGVSEITGIKSTLNKILFANQTYTDKSGVTKTANLADYGLSLNKEGLLELDSSKLGRKLDEDLQSVQKIFAGGTTYGTAQAFSSKAVDAGSLTIANEDLVINGKKINLPATAATNTSKQNALALLKAINDAGIAGVQATMASSEDKITLKTTNGTAISIKGSPATLNAVGLSESTITPKSTTVNGIFSSAKKTVDGLINSKNGSLTKYGQSLIEEKKTLDAEKERTQKSLDAKYATMEERFLAYDKIISKLNSEFSSLKSMIEAEYNKK